MFAKKGINTVSAWKKMVRKGDVVQEISGAEKGVQAVGRRHITYNEIHWSLRSTPGK